MSSNFIFKPLCWLGHNRLSASGGCLEKHGDQPGSSTAHVPTFVSLPTCWAAELQAHCFLPRPRVAWLPWGRLLHGRPSWKLLPWPPDQVQGSSAHTLGIPVCAVPGPPPGRAPHPKPLPTTSHPHRTGNLRSPDEAQNPMASLVNSIKRLKKN